MPELPTAARVIIIGGGAVGTSALYHLCKRGWNDALLLEKNQLTAGSTWHAAGNVPTFSGSWSIMNLQRYSAELYRILGTKVDYPMNYHVTGSIRLAHTKNRLKEFHRAVGMGKYQGLNLSILDLDEIKELYPFIETHDLIGALYDPNDGDIDPAQLTQAMAKGARNLGAKIFQNTEVTFISRENNEWIVHTPEGNIRCEIVVNSAGYYSKRVGDYFLPFGGRKVPMATMSHQYILTEEIPELKEWTKQEGKKLPLLRDVDISYYLRQEKNGLNLGPYERNCLTHWNLESAPMPDDFSFQLFESDTERLEFYIEDACNRVPLLGKAGIQNVINGPIPYAPDGNPLIGPMPGVRNAFECCVFTFGIAQAGGAGKVLAEWIAEGQTEWDMWSCDPRRYTDYTDQSYCEAKAREVYGNEYAIHFPYHEWPSARNKKLSPIHDKIVALGGQMGVYNGWERANWFAHPEDDKTEEATLTWYRKGPWEPRIRQECEAVHESVGVLDLPGFARFNLNGDGASEWLATRIAGSLPKIGRMNLGYFPTNKGRVLTEMSILRHGENSFTLITAATAQWHDYEVLKMDLPSNLKLADVTDQFSTLVVSGPKSKEVFHKISNADLSLPWLSHQTAEVVGKPVTLVRVSFAGELGWEIHSRNDHVPDIYDTLCEEKVKPFGMYALNSLRIEKGFRAWKGDLSTDYSLLESSLDRFVKFDKSQEFPGKKALLIERQSGSKKRFAVLTIEQDEYDTPYMSTLWHDGAMVGETTSGSWGYRVKKNIALAILRADLVKPGTELMVDVFGEMYPAVVQGGNGLYDPTHSRLKS
ncbi:MAG: FAD-dependent oxidoreductase [Rhodobacteraceae bacterium]|nr:FAD-dependent oxidoreductase [Paracoccaceae bacterium]